MLTGVHKKGKRNFLMNANNRSQVVKNLLGQGHGGQSSVKRDATNKWKNKGNAAFFSHGGMTI